MSSREKIAYLKGLIDGLKISDPDISKVLSAVVESLDALADEIEDQRGIIMDQGNALEEISEYLDQLDDDISSLEDRIDPCCCDHDEEDDEDGEEYVSVCCPNCHKDFFYDPSSYDEDEDLLCPHCGEPFNRPE
ncbi:hypothetical protein TheveDRAFT_0757 [Thermanaerovibrio velox DSM 12556]|uniref:Uncharacterized protein n=1 Tax=Thermanaerovibrio velox DSM 12556 TaxID=926567 RepID=H0URG8_9BACT|nr:CD1247 N-terminal domain-containing protein [Thermanaerovibrio velox]EHM09907.1 hypothetical protein TheveDRAFT_0757 [Thermanaerovibrio velox DSM 12556]